MESFDSRPVLRLKDKTEAETAMKAAAELFSSEGRNISAQETAQETGTAYPHYFRIFYSGKPLEVKTYYAPCHFKTRELAEAFAASVKKLLGGKVSAYVLEGVPDETGRYYARFFHTAKKLPKENAVLLAAVEAAGRYDFSLTSRNEVDEMVFRSENYLLPPDAAAKLYERFTEALAKQPGVKVVEKALSSEGFTVSFSGALEVRSTVWETTGDGQAFLSGAEKLALEAGLTALGAPQGGQTYFLYFGKPWPDSLTETLTKQYKAKIIR